MRVLQPQREHDFERSGSGDSGLEGHVHSLITGSMVDGPGVRTVVWTSGCEFRCQYCHNPDTWHLKGGSRMTADAVLQELARYAKFSAAGHGGVTVSGGEPLVQTPFVLRVLRGCKEMGIHTALDTNGYLGERLTDADLQLADLVLLDLKSMDPETHRRVTGKDVAPVLRFAQRLSDLGRPMWLRFVLVPGVTDAWENVSKLASFASSLRGVERFEVLPFHQLGKAKWAEIGETYPLEHVKPPTPAQLGRAKATFRAHGLPVS